MKEKLINFINERLDFLHDHWVEHDKPPYKFGGWREEVVNDIAENGLSQVLKEIQKYQMGFVKSDGDDGFEYAPEYSVLEDLIAYLKVLSK